MYVQRGMHGTVSCYIYMYCRIWFAFEAHFFQISHRLSAAIWYLFAFLYLQKARAVKQIWKMIIFNISSGTVPVLYMMKENSKSKETVEFCTDVLRWLQGEMRGPVLALLSRTLSMDGNNAVRGAMGISMLYLSCGAPHILSAFVHDGKI